MGTLVYPSGSKLRTATAVYLIASSYLSAKRWRSPSLYLAQTIEPCKDFSYWQSLV